MSGLTPRLARIEEPAPSPSTRSAPAMTISVPQTPFQDGHAIPQLG